MNSLVENRTLLEISCGSNFAYILNDNSNFLPTEYKVLQSQGDEHFIKCMKMLYNGQIQLYYVTNFYKSFSHMLSRINPDDFITIAKNLFFNIADVKSNGFLSCENIDISLDRIFVDPNTYKVSLVYLPISEHLFDDVSSFENELKITLIKLVSDNASLYSEKTKRLSENLQDETLTIKDICYKFRKGIKEPTTKSSARLVGLNTPVKIEIAIDKHNFKIGRKQTNDAVITFNRMIGRLHCEIVYDNGQYSIIDLQSSNGTYINNVKAPPNKLYPIKSGDIIRLANSNFRFIVKKG